MIHPDPNRRPDVCWSSVEATEAAHEVIRRAQDYAKSLLANGGEGALADLFELESTEEAHEALRRAGDYAKRLLAVEGDGGGVALANLLLSVFKLELTNHAVRVRNGEE